MSALWPKKKEFIEGAYKLLLFSKGQRRYALSAIKVLRENGILPEDFFDFKQAFGRVMRAWYERRIEEETAKNRKLKELHDNLMKVRELQKR